LARIAVHRQEALPELEPEDEEFWNLVRGLPAKQSQAIALFYLEDRSVADIAQILECSPATAKVHLFRGRQNLATKLNLETPR
jgi:RNA polymerase sigma factor (sigma-70 family)